MMATMTTTTTTAHHDDLDNRRRMLAHCDDGLEAPQDIVEQRQHHLSSTLGDNEEQQQQQQQENILERMRQVRNRNRAVLHEVDVARALVEACHRRQEEEDDGQMGSRHRLAQSQAFFLEVVQEELSLLPASWQDKMLETSATKATTTATAAGSANEEEGEEEEPMQRRGRQGAQFAVETDQAVRRIFARQRQEQLVSLSSYILSSEEEPEEEEEKEEEEEEEETTAPPSPAKPCPPFVTPPWDPLAAAAAADVLQNAPPLLENGGKAKHAQRRRRRLEEGAPDIRDMTPADRLAVIQHLVRSIEAGLLLAGGRLRAARLGYPAAWDGRITAKVQQEERELYRLIKAGGGLDDPHKTTPNLPICCLVLLHILHFSARELLPLDLLQGVVDEAKVARYHRLFPRSAALWVALRRHVRFLLRNRVLTASELGNVFGQALLGDMTKRENVEGERLYRKIVVLLGSMAAGLAEEEQEKETKEAAARNAHQQKKQEQEERERVARSEFEQGVPIPPATRKSKPAPTTKKGFLSRVLRWE